MKKYYCLNDDDKVDYAAVLWRSSRAVAIETSQDGYEANIYLSPADARALAADILAAADEVEGVERKSESDYARRRAAIILGQVRP